MAQFTNSPPFANLNQVEIFQLTSSDIADGQPLSGRYLSGRMQIPGGQDVSPQLSWWGFPPAETKSFAVTMYDPRRPPDPGRLVALGGLRHSGRGDRTAHRRGQPGEEPAARTGPGAEQ